MRRDNRRFTGSTLDRGGRCDAAQRLGALQPAQGWRWLREDSSGHALLSVSVNEAFHVHLPDDMLWKYDCPMGPARLEHTRKPLLHRPLRVFLGKRTVLSIIREPLGGVLFAKHLKACVQGFAKPFSPDVMVELVMNDALLGVMPKGYGLVFKNLDDWHGYSLN